MSSREELEAAAQAIAAELDELERLASIATGFIAFGTRREHYGNFWAKAKELTALFKASRLVREDRERLWARREKLCDEVRRHQDDDRLTRQVKSEQKTDLIRSVIREAENWVNGAEEGSHLQKARERLNHAKELLKDHALQRDDRQDCWDRWKEVSDALFARRDSLYDSNYDAIERDISDAANAASYGNPHEAVRQIKAIQKAISQSYLSKDQRTSLREKLDEWWDKAISRIEEQRAERDRKHAEWRDRTEAKIDRLSTLLEKNEGIIQRLQDQIDDLEEKINNARSEEWADMARGWVEEKYNKIRDIEATNRELEEKIRDLQERLNEDR